MASIDYCFICDEKLDNGDEIKLVKQKGINTFIEKSKNYGDNKWPTLEKVTEVKVHRNCAKNYSLGRKVMNTAAPPTPSTSHETGEFDFKSHCLLCGSKCHLGPKLWTLVKTQLQQENIEKWINLRGDDWSETVKQRIDSTSLVEMDARFHRTCYKQFARMPLTNERGRPKSSNLEDAFADVYRFMEENEDSPFLLSELMEKLQDLSVVAATFKQKLINRYGSDILIMAHKGTQSVVCFRNTAHKILMDSCHRKKAITETRERLQVVHAAAEIVREDIRSGVNDTALSPTPQEPPSKAVNDAPETLETFLDVVLLKGKKNRDHEIIAKRNSIAHSIISVARPRNSISSIQLAKPPSAPEAALQVTFCSCKENCSNHCGCRKAGIKCSSVCSGCHCDSCTNSIEADMPSDSASDTNHCDEGLNDGLDLLNNENLDKVYTDQQTDEPFHHLDEIDSMIIENDHSTASDEKIVMKKPRLV